ncbi:Uncharacterised protein [[Clostridium] sordellii]|nr:Uncharacterised protein [[Clostridium] sordellii] [Paeniclostridium sordellii]
MKVIKVFLRNSKGDSFLTQYESDFIPRVEECIMVLNKEYKVIKINHVVLFNHIAANKHGCRVDVIVEKV